jgi:hypothetical protein
LVIERDFALQITESDVSYEAADRCVMDTAASQKKLVYVYELPAGFRLNNPARLQLTELAEPYRREAKQLPPAVSFLAASFLSLLRRGLHKRAVMLFALFLTID